MTAGAGEARGYDSHAARSTQHAARVRLAFGLALAAALIVPLACGVDRGESERGPDEPLDEAPSPWIAHGLSWKVNTNNSGEAYIAECQAAGVPVPAVVADPTDPRWTNHGVLTTDFLGNGADSELWSYEDPNIDGVCAALPRWDGLFAGLYGVICLSRTTGHSCFWDNPFGVLFPRGIGIPMDRFVGGKALKDNGQGVCSDCHAGENPFVVHPLDPAFASFRQARDLSPNAWPKPHVPSAFPGNPGPLDALGPVPAGEVACDGCHNTGNGIRFPLVSNKLPGYCGTILGGAIEATMPPTGDGSTHADWLLSLCVSSPITGQVVPVEQVDPEFLGPPQLGSIYACASQILVSGLLYGATVEVWVGPNPVTVPAVAAGPTMAVDLGQPLIEAETVSVRQKLGSLSSSITWELVQDHKDVYPDGLPPPTITPAPLYTCARSIATQNVPGVELIIEKHNGGAVVATHKFETPAVYSGTSSLPPPAFVLGDSFTVKQRMCDDISEPSQEVAVVSAPTSLADPAFVPTLVEGQQIANIGSIVQGAQVWVDSNGTSVIDMVSMPFNVWQDVDLAKALGSPVNPSHGLTLGQKLCGQYGASEIFVGACNPSELVAQVAPPVEGDPFVVVTEAVPGATLYVLASDGQIGMASGSVITLARALLGGATITVVEELPGCVATNGFQIQVLDL